MLVQRVAACLMLTAVCVVLPAAEPAADSPGMVKPSTYAAAADLVAQADFYLDRLTEALSNPADYDEAKQSRVRKDANTLAVLALVLGRHDEANKYRGRAAAMIPLAISLANQAADPPASTKNLADLKAAATAEGAAGAEPAWTQVADLAALMKQVPVVNASLKRGLDPARFKKQSAQIAGQAATLAAIAQASWFDTAAISDAADVAKWQQLCAEMRDAAGTIGAAARSGDQAAASAGFKRMTVSCDACHAVFRHE